MNKSRRMYSELARRLSLNNQNVLLIDLYGTGDSEGLLEDATWQDWLHDIQACLSVLYDKGAERVSLLGMRTGVLLAADYLNKFDSKIQKLLFWQPVIDGKVFLNQFMRLRLAASMMSGDKNKETSKGLKASLDRGETLEIAGYAITPSMASSFESASLKEFMPDSSLDIAWLDVVASVDKEPPLINRKLVKQWRQAGVNIQYQKVVGMPFWGSTEIVEIPELLDVSQAFFIEKPDS